MARLNKKHFDEFKIASYRLAGEEQSGEGVKIVSQRATRRFRLQIGDKFAVLTLVPKQAGTLAQNEFRIAVDGENVAKITNRSVTVGTDGVKIKY
tara:strand:+ start:221 stop:505 length:285 start_codon:yes stop_codon:yes gene_type:complete